MKITELTPSRECPPEAIEDALKALLDMRPGRSGNFVQVHMDRKGNLSQRATVGAACHANLGVRFAAERSREVVGLCHSNGGDDFKHTEAFYDWFIHRSFASRFVVGENQKGFVIDCDIPPELLQNIGIISRHGWELKEAPFKMFDYIVSKGYREETAYVCSMNSGLNSDNSSLDVLLRQAVGDALGGHRAWRMFSIAALKNFLTDEFGAKLTEFSKKASARTRATINGGLSLCDAGPSLSDYRTVPPESFTKELMTKEDHSKFREALATFRQSGGEMYRPPNPFVRNLGAIPPNMMSFNELIEVALPYLKQEGLPV